jgi:hypothetical protein
MTHTCKPARFNRYRLIQYLGLFALALVVTSAHAANRGGQVLTLNLKGTGTAYLAEIPVIDGTGTTTGTCFDVGLFDMSTGLQVGTATDCLADLVDEMGGTRLIGTTYFKFTGGATIVTRGKTTVMPVLHGSPGFTHVTGAGADGNGILSGTNQYANASGSVRLSGLVNLSKLASDGQITFDCIFVMNLD